MASKYSESTGLPVGQGMYWKRGVIYVAIWYGGKKQSYCCGTDKPEEARKFRAKKLAELVTEDDSRVKTGIRCGELLTRYIAKLKRKEEDAGEYMTANPKATVSYKTASSIKHLARFEKIQPKDITTDMLNAYHDERIKVAGVVTVNRELGYLRTAINDGVKDGKVNRNHVPTKWPINIAAERNAAHTGIITDQQYQDIMKVAADHLRPILATVMYVGVRSKEIKFVRTEQVHFDTLTIDLLAGETKEGDPRILPINNHVKEILLDWQRKTQENWPGTKWFFHFEGKQIKSWKTAWHAALRRCGLRVKLENGKWKNLVRFHDTRRAAITGMDTIGGSEADTQVVSGHKTKSMARQYNQSPAAVERIRLAQNAALVPVNTPEPIAAPATTANDWKAELRELKATFDEGLLPEDLYKAEVVNVMANRHN
jgi:integrase